MKVVLPDGSIGDEDVALHPHTCAVCQQRFNCSCLHPLRRRECSECFLRQIKGMLDALDGRLFPALAKHAKKEKL